VNANKQSSGMCTLEEAPVRPFTVLVVDDAKSILSFIKIKLQVSGYKVFTAENAFEALGILKDQDIDLTIVDFMLPKIDGMELIKQIRTFTQVPVIMLTARDSVNIQLQAFASGADDFMTKPFDPDELVAHIERLRNRVLWQTATA
jgi:DNA-binding response OmpR family regulator